MSRPVFADAILGPSGAPVPNAAITLRQPGTSTPITDSIYATSSGGSPLTQPLAGDAYGRVHAYPATPQTVDLYVTGAGFDPFTVVDYAIYPRPEDSVTQDGVAVLSNKTLSSPIVNNMTALGGSWQDATLNGTVSIGGTPTITGATLAGKTTLPTNGAARVFEGLASAIGNAGWGSPGLDVTNPTHTAIVIGTTSPTIAPGRPAILIEHHSRDETLAADAVRPVDTVRVVRKLYDQGTLDPGYIVPPEQAVIHSVYETIALGAASSAAGIAVENYAARGYVEAGSSQAGFGYYTIQTLRSTSGYVFGGEFDTTNGMGVHAPIYRQRQPGYGSAAMVGGHMFGLNVLADGSNHSTAGLLIQGAPSSKWQDGIVYNALAVVPGGNAIDASQLPSTVVGLFAANGAVAVAAAKNEANTGAVASASPTTLTVAGTPWSASAFSATGQWVEITGGTGVGQARQITANTNNTLTVGAWAVTPTAGSTFAISPNRINVLGTAADNSIVLYSDAGWAWKTNDGSAQRMTLSAIGGLATSSTIAAGGALFTNNQTGVGMKSWRDTALVNNALLNGGAGLGGTTLDGFLLLRNHEDGTSIMVAVNGSLATPSVTMPNNDTAPAGFQVNVDAGAGVRIFWTASILYVRNATGGTRKITATFIGEL